MKDLLFNPCTSRVKRVLRWLVCRGECRATEFKARHVALGGTEHFTHAFDRYFVGNEPERYRTDVPFNGTHALINRARRAGPGSKIYNQFWYVWVGSHGADFRVRAFDWLRQVDYPTLSRAFQTCERQLVDALDEQEEQDTIAWLQEIEGESARRAFRARKGAAA